jgi:Ferritin-like domain
MTSKMTRRDFLRVTVAGVMVGGLTAGCGTPQNDSGGLLKTEHLLAGVEVAVLSAYHAVVNGPQSGRLGKVPSVVAEFASIAQSHHQAHLDHWNESFLNTRQGKQSTPDPILASRIRASLIAIKTMPDALDLLSNVEEISAETCAANLQAVPDSNLRRWCGLIAPVESQHAAILRFLLGQDPTPTSALGLSLART